MKYTSCGLPSHVRRESECDELTRAQFVEPVPEVGGEQSSQAIPLFQTDDPVLRSEGHLSRGEDAHYERQRDEHRPCSVDRRIANESHYADDEVGAEDREHKKVEIRQEAPVV